MLMNRFILVSAVVFIGAVASLKTESKSDLPSVQTVSSTPEFMEIDCTDQLNKLYQKHGFNVNDIRLKELTVPRLHLSSLPHDFKLKQTGSKKDTFVRVMLPLILEVNKNVSRERQLLLALKDRLTKGRKLQTYEFEWIETMAEKYRVNSTDINDLLHKVDVIPPSLALAQASLESGWLMSTAARLKNSTFGHMANKKDVEGFESLYANVEAYILNLNRHNAYRDLRKLRADMRQSGKDVCSETLANGLKSYSERGTAYIRDVKKMIQQNDFKAFDEVALDT